MRTDGIIATLLVYATVVGLVVIARAIVAGIVGVLWLLYGALILTARLICWIEDEHDRRMRRVRAYETRRAPSGTLTG